MTRRPRAPGLAGPLLLVGLALSGAPAVASAQQPVRDPAAQAADSAGPQVADTAAQADSTRQRIFERLQRLGRPLGSDSALFVQDSLRLARSEGGGGEASGMDSVAARLSGLPGYSVIRYDAGSASFDAGSRVLVLRAPEEGRARVSQGGTTVEADSSITFNEETGRVSTVGAATFTPPGGDPVESVNMIYDLEQGRGTATGAHTEFSEGGTTWYVNGDMPFANQDSTFMSHARFTSCDLEVPHYHFETDEIKIVGGGVMVAKGVRLYFADVPVAWLPFMAQSLSQGRASGLLTPRFSLNDIVRTSGGYRRRLSNVGFYWAMSDYSDALIAFDWFSDTFFAVESQFQYRFNRQFLFGRVDARRYWRTGGERSFALNTSHSWDPDERTHVSVDARFIDDQKFLLDTSFDPGEVTRTIDSNGGINRRFDWGTMDVAVGRTKYLSDDRVHWKLPDVRASVSTITLFPAPTSDAHLWNNLSWSASSSFTRELDTRERLDADTFSVSLANTASKSASFSHRFGIGNLTIGQGANFSENQRLDVPLALIGLGGAVPPLALVGDPSRDITQTRVGWNTSLSYQQQLIGSTTITPSVNFSGSLVRSDTSSVTRSFVSSPAKVSLQAALKTDIYGFYPGFGPFDAVRHKLSPSFTYAWSPGTQPNARQLLFFGAQALQPENLVAVTLNQTWEARRATPDTAVAEPQPDSLGLEDLVAPAGARGEPRRVQQAQTVKLLGLTTSAVRYDFVRADSAGFANAGFTSTTLSNTISSDYLRGLSISLTHDLFEDAVTDGELVSRRFAPRLSNVNLSFSLGSSSAIARWLGLGEDSGEDEADAAAPQADSIYDPFAPTDPFAVSGATDEFGIIPGSRDASTDQNTGGGDQGTWNANLSYSLQRPRASTTPSQMLSGGLTLHPTANWDASWSTSYDLERGAFNDHTIRLTRDLHRWQAHFDFRQTATGNWSFRFEVSLIDNRDLKFDYSQRNLDVGLPGEGG